MDTSRQIARRLLEVGAVKLQPRDPFTWASGLRSPIYCDNRVLLSFPSHPHGDHHGAGGGRGCHGKPGGRSGRRYGRHPPRSPVGGPPRAPLHLRAQFRQGTRPGRNQIEGRLQPGHRYLVVEDLISTGGSSLQAVEVLRSAGAEVAGTVAIFTYQFPSAERAFERAEVPLVTISHYGALLDEAMASGQISAEESGALADWREDPRAWSERFLS